MRQLQPERAEAICRGRAAAMAAMIRKPKYSIRWRQDAARLVNSSYPSANFGKRLIARTRSARQDFARPAAILNGLLSWIFLLFAESFF